VQDQPDGRGACHLMHCSQYLIAARPRWVKTKGRPAGSEAYRAFLQRRAKRAEFEGDTGAVRFGPGRASAW
jgi:hypothetical protein